MATQDGTRKPGPLPKAEWKGPGVGVNLPPVDITRRAWDIWSTQAGVNVDDLLPRHKWLKPEDRPALELQAMQASIVALDLVVADRTLSHDDLLDALGARFSETFRNARGGATHARDMTLKEVGDALDELEARGIEFKRLLIAVRGDELPRIKGEPQTYRGVPGLFKVVRKRSLHVILEDDDTLARWRRIMNVDSGWRDGTGSHLLLADDPWPPRPTTDRVAGGWRHYGVEPGERNLRVSKILEGFRPWLVTEEALIGIAADIDTLDGRTDKKAAQERRSLQSKFTQVVDAMNRTDDGRHLRTKTRYAFNVNGRYHPLDFAPQGTSNKDRQDEVFSDDLPMSFEASNRERQWEADSPLPTGPRRVPLVGADISGSQWQILAVLLGLRDLETRLSEKPFKVIVRERAVDLVAEGKFHSDPTLLKRLEDTVKFAGTRLGYGSSFSEVAYKLKWDRKSPVRELALGQKDLAESLEALFKDEQLGLGAIFNDYLPRFCRLAKVICRRNAYSGFAFTNRFDGATYRWNPVKRWGPSESWKTTSRLRKTMTDLMLWIVTAHVDSEPYAVQLAQLAAGIRRRERAEREHDAKRPHVKRGPVRIDVDLPIGMRAKDGPDAGDYEVDEDALARMLAPVFIQVIDGMDATLVVERLHAAGIPVSSNHDSWLVPQYKSIALDAAIYDSGEELLPAIRDLLDPVIETFEDPVHGIPEDAAWSRGLRVNLQKRIDAGDYPRFLAKHSGPKLHFVADDGTKMAIGFLASRLREMEEAGRREAMETLMEKLAAAK